MKPSIKTMTAFVAATAIAVGVSACGGDSDSGEQTTTTTVPSTTTTTAPDQLPTLEDGKWFGFVITDTNGSAIELLIDPAEMLTGEEAHAAAVEAGVITEDEDLHNDFFIANPDSQTYLVPVTVDAAITVLSAEAVDTRLTVDITELSSIFGGSYEGEMIYGIVPGQPAAFEITITNGAATEVAQVYTP